MSGTIKSGNRMLGVVEIADLLESMTPLIECIVRDDGFVTAAEQQLLDVHRALVTDSQSLAVRTQIGMSLIRGLEAPPERVTTLIDDYRRVYGARPLAGAAD